MGLIWDDDEDIAMELAEAHPDVDPLDISFPTMLKWITELKGWEDDPQSANEGKLENIQMKWHEEFRGR
ncbi:MAG: Fe-S cluster assembly protein IscX [Chloroflexi bacterium]|nr:Fe-S cluster assembly protein IscX [Chloroflexota bacterium]